MKKSFLRKSLCALAVCALLSGGRSWATKTWTGTITSADNASNEDVNITGDCIINGDVTIRASGALNQVDVNLTAGAATTMRAGTDNPRLFLVAEDTSSIRFNVSEDFIFTGSTNPLLIVVSGNVNQVRGAFFILDNGKKVSFTAENAEAEGTKLFVDNRSGTVGPGPSSGGSLRFTRSSPNSGEHVHIVVGSKSIMSYIADDGDADVKEAYITFVPENEGEGRMVLHVEDTGAVYVAASDAGTVARPTLTLSDIDMTTLAIPAAASPSHTSYMRVENNFSAGRIAGLLVANKNATLTDLIVNPWQEAAAFSGNRYGFVVCTGGRIEVESNAYLDYVGLTNNICPTPNIPSEYLHGKTVAQVVKKRNPSAFIADDLPNANAAIRATVFFEDNSAAIFRSGVDKDGTINWGDVGTEYGNDGAYSFTIDPANETTGQGEIVLAADGRLEFRGGDAGGEFETKIEILSYEVNPSGGTVLVGGSSNKLFPLRTFAKDGNGDYLQYNSACFFINNRMNLLDTYLVHTDENHSVYEKDDVKSEPTYVGGETHFLLDDDSLRPWIAFYSSEFRLHTSAAFTGVDLLIPNPSDAAAMAGPPKKGLNSIDDTFNFFHNGYAYNNGTGRQLILGTEVGSCGCDSCCSSISKDAHLNIFQVNEQPESSVGLHQLKLTTTCNDSTIVENLGDFCGQDEVHTIYLGHSSNISIGSQDGVYVDPVYSTTPATTDPKLIIAGNYFSFETRGGPLACPETSAYSGAGGIFVDSRGEFKIEAGYRANIATMVTKSGDGVVSLPLSQIYFDNRVGIADWKLTLTTEEQRIIVDTNETVSDYTLNWRYVTKDWNNTSTPFLPYDVSSISSCTCPEVTLNNIATIPVVKGMIEQMQIKGSRLGSPAHLMVDGGWIRELIFLNGCDSADAPVGVLVVKNNGRIGLGSKHKNRDSIGGSIKLGANGVMIIADGDGRIDVNEDLIIDNYCHILKGPNFGMDAGNPVDDRLTFFSDCCKEIIVKKGGVLDLSQFDVPNTYDSQNIIEFAGNVRLILEEGSKVVLGRNENGFGPTVQFTDQSRCESAELTDLSTFVFGTTVASTDDLRVRLVGIGLMQFLEDSVFFVGDDTYVGIESDPDCDEKMTAITFDVGDRAQILVGQPGNINSVLQIGNTSYVVDGKVSFTLNLEGVDSVFKIASKGFFGMGVGMVNNFFTAPSNWLIDVLFNLEGIHVLCPAGTIVHDRIFSSASAPASLIAVLDTSLSTTPNAFEFDADNTITNDKTQATILGGGNMILLSPYYLDDVQTPSAIEPIVQTTDGVFDSRRIVGLFSSKAILQAKDTAGSGISGQVTGAQLFNYWKVPDFVGTSGGFTCASQDEHNLLSLGYADGATIERGFVDEIVTKEGISIARKLFRYTLSIGAVNIDLGTGTAPRPVNAVVELP